MLGRGRGGFRGRGGGRQSSHLDGGFGGGYQQMGMSFDNQGPNPFMGAYDNNMGGYGGGDMGGGYGDDNMGGGYGGDGMGGRGGGMQRDTTPAKV